MSPLIIIYKMNCIIIQDQMNECKLVLPRDIWMNISSFVVDIEYLSVCNKELNEICEREARLRILHRQRIVEVNKTNSLMKHKGFIGFLKLPAVKCAIVPCIRVNLDGRINAVMLLIQDGPLAKLKQEFSFRTKLNADNYEFAVVSDHSIESTLDERLAIRSSLLKRCGIFAYESIADSKHIEVRLKGTFNGRVKLFGIPLVIFVPRIVDRDYVHRVVWQRIQPFINNSSQYVSPPYKLSAYNKSVYGVSNEVAFTADYMVIDSQMHAVGEQLTLVVDFGINASNILNTELFKDPSTVNNIFVPAKSMKIVTILMERDCGIRMN